ncbi:SufD family Fe-S cluster assembly protein [Candidatus Babeliales bacterium]|nr:SufD family Fe-S cluster assembly protein [Candidatus Babeliales bacterium]
MSEISNIVIQYTCEENNATYSLFDIVKPHINGAYAFPHLNLTLTVPAEYKVSFNDDLLSYGFSSTKIQIIVKRYGKAEYKKIITNQGTVPTEADFTIRCDEEYAEAEAIFCCKGIDQQKIIINTRQEHTAPRTKSNLIIKAVLDNYAQIKSNTMIFVEKGAHQVDASQTSKNIMLSSTAHAIAVPKLEVLADDVLCKHGAAISMIDSEALFYLQSRGLSEQGSKKMIIDSFLQ